MVQHVDCMRVRESELTFDSHMSGFVYKVRVHGHLLIKKEIPGPDNVDEFLYEINALSQLVANGAENVIRFYGVVVDDDEKHVTGLLISYAARGAMIDVIYDGNHHIPWPIRERWARQIVGGLAEIHEAGFVQGDFTLSNIVVDGNNDAKIIDINRRGCPIGWEPPEVTPLIESNQRISMYIGVKSDLYQLGMVLWALATQEDEPDRFPRPLKIDPNLNVPTWYRRVVDTCLNPDPRQRVHATHLLSMFPEPPAYGGRYHHGRSTVPMNGDAGVQHGYPSPTGFPHLRSGHPANFGFPSHPYQAEDVFRYPSRGRSPPSPSPSDHGGYNDPVPQHRMPTWSETIPRVPPAPSVSDVLAGEGRGSSMPRLQGNGQTFDTSANGRYRPTGPATEYSMDDSYFAGHNRRFPGQDSYYAKAEELVRRNSTWASPSNEWQPDAQHGARQDATELASTPRGSRVSGGRYSPTTRDRSVSRGRRGRSSRDAGSDGRRSSSRSPGEQRRTDDPLTRSPPPPYQEHGVPPEQVSDSDYQAKKHRRRKHHRQHEQRDASPEALSPANSDVDLRFVGSMHDPSHLDSKATTVNGSASPPHRFSIDEDLMEGVTPTNSQDVDMDDEMDEKRAIYASVPQAVAIDV
jgi:serine/threonine protein kinase